MHKYHASRGKSIRRFAPGGFHRMDPLGTQGLIQMRDANAKCVGSKARSGSSWPWGGSLRRSPDWRMRSSPLKRAPFPPPSSPSPAPPLQKTPTSRWPRLSSRSRTGGSPRRPLAPRRSSVPRSHQQAVAHAFGSLGGRRVPLGGMPLTFSRQERYTYSIVPDGQMRLCRRGGPPVRAAPANTANTPSFRLQGLLLSGQRAHPHSPREQLGKDRRPNDLQTWSKSPQVSPSTNARFISTSFAPPGLAGRTSTRFQRLSACDSISSPAPPCRRMSAHAWGVWRADESGEMACWASRPDAFVPKARIARMRLSGLCGCCVRRLRGQGRAARPGHPKLRGSAGWRRNAGEGRQSRPGDRLCRPTTNGLS